MQDPRVLDFLLSESGFKYCPTNTLVPLAKLRVYKQPEVSLRLVDVSQVAPCQLAFWTTISPSGSPSAFVNSGNCFNQRAHALYIVHIIRSTNHSVSVYSERTHINKYTGEKIKTNQNRRANKQFKLVQRIDRLAYPLPGPPQPDPPPK